MADRRPVLKTRSHMVTLDSVLLSTRPGFVRWYCWRHNADPYLTPARGNFDRSRGHAIEMLARHLLTEHGITDSARQYALPLGKVG